MDFPITIRVHPQTISQQLVSVRPLNGVSLDEISEIKATNRNNKIESILNDTEFIEKLVEDSPNYSGPKGTLHYLDYKYP